VTRRIEVIRDILYGVHAFRNVMRAKAASLSEKDHMSHAQWYVMTVIGQAGEISVKDLAEQLAMSSSAVTQFADGLVEHGFVKRYENPRDRRSALLTLNAKGREHLVATDEIRLGEMAELFEGLTDSELEEYARLLNKITSGFWKSKF
jgi:MarR family 2-MHQ and catechol resistance regulon transcriptional repressor